jgi:iron(II)-dependent oxidoreductase
MAAVRERALEAPVDPELHELVIRHELQHTETMLQAMRLGGLLPPSFTGPAAVPGSGLEMVEIPEGPAEIGATSDGFAYDNERPRHTEHTGRFTIGRTPVTNASWLTFAEGGGYERREWWSDEGWAWKEQYDITHHAGARTGDPGAPVVCVSWFEAAAFARAHDARLPSEIEWEKAATSGQIEGTGEVWEWTESHFGGYPGFVAHPYREYSEVFFGDRYRVLRGGSCATHPRVASPHFRNWDLPERRQLFAGVRIAR